MERSIRLTDMRTTIIVFIALLSLPSWATNYTVKASGGSFTTMAACASQMSTNGTGVSDTCTVFAGTYAESPTVPAGSVGNYKIFTINGSDVVHVTGSFTLNSHTKVSGFVFNQTGSCFSLSGSATDVYIGPNNSLTSCGTLNINIGNSFIYFQGNTWAYAGCVPPTPVNTCGRAINADGSHLLIENNDFSHYQLGIVLGSNTGAVSNIIIRNNTFHDQLETEAGSNGHSDSIFAEPANGVANTLIEGNYERNAVGPNAKGFLLQNDSGCTTNCTQTIIRFNIMSRSGSGEITNDKSWPNVKLYNGTFVDEGMESGFNTPGGGGDNMSSTGGGQSVLNGIWYSTTNFNSWNPYQCNGCVSYGHSLAWCTGTCTIYGHNYQSGSFTSDTGNQNANPLFVNYVGAGSTSNNFHLQAGSPAIAAGTYLTTVAAGDSGSGTSLVVTDAAYFQDGYGLTNTYSTVSGDCIAVTTVSNHVCVTAVNYSTNTLTLASGFSRSNGDHVWLYSKSDGVQVLTGSAPDMGAFPYSSSGPAPPHGLTVLGVGYFKRKVILLP
jgi:hypothetical protein